MIPFCILKLYAFLLATGIWSATLYERDYHQGKTLTLIGNGTECISLVDKYICAQNDTSCIVAAGKTSSISTHNTCVRVYRNPDCHDSHIELKPGTDCQYSWSACKLNGVIHSISGCQRTGTNHETNIKQPPIATNRMVTLYENNNFHGKSLTLNITNMNCINLHDKNLCDTSNNCRGSSQQVSSMIIHGVNIKVRMFSELNCKQPFAITFDQSTPSCKEDLKSCGFNDKAKSIWINVILNTAISVQKLKLTDPVPVESGSEIPIIGFRRSSPNFALVAETIIQEDKRKIVIYIPGFATTNFHDGIELKNAIFSGTTDVDTVYLYDWRKYLIPVGNETSIKWIENFKQVALKNIRKAAIPLEDFLAQRISEFSRIHLIGFSFGGQLAGIVARSLKQKFSKYVVDRISAIDPVGPVFEHSLNGMLPLDTTNTLRKSDAPFIDVIHSKSELAMKKPVGHLDVYVDEVECNKSSLMSCAHHKTLRLYFNSISKCSLITCPMGRLILQGDHFVCAVKIPHRVSSLGYLSSYYKGRGKHEIKLYKSVLLNGATQERQAVSTGNCSTFLNIEFPAKDRICALPPNNVSQSCANTPYLGKCTISCDTGNLTLFCTAKNNNNYDNWITLGADKEPVPGVGGVTSVTWAGGPCPSPVSCINSNGRPVDYFINYKPPGTFKYYYLDPSTKGSFSYSDTEIQNVKSNIGLTLSPIHNSSINYLMWNDETGLFEQKAFVPNDDDDSYGYFDEDEDFQLDEEYQDDTQTTPGETFGHSKGIIGFNKDGGFVIIHSIVSFPPRPGTFQFANPKLHTYAQMVLCISYGTNFMQKRSEISLLLEGMKIMKPKGYSMRTQGDVEIKVANKMETLMNYDGITPLPLHNESTRNVPDFGLLGFNIHINSNVGSSVDNFIKLAEEYKSNLLVQYWESNKQVNSYCTTNVTSPYTVENISQMQISSGGSNWNSTSDLSTWLISKTPGKENSSVVCIGDSILQGHGGMFACIKNNMEIYNAFQGLPKQIEECKKYPTVSN